MPDADTTSLDPIFRPRAVAVIGASPKKNALGNAILQNLFIDGFDGPVFPVNPRHKVVHSMKCYPTVGAIPDPVDLAVVVVPAVAVIGVVKEALEAGVRGFVIISAGFKEIGGDGIERETDLIRMLNAHGARAIGPNCMGIINLDPRVRLHATFAPIRPLPGRVGFISQSGALGVTLLIHAGEMHLGVRQFASIGNKADISSNELLEYWTDDDNIGLVLMYLENFGSPERFPAIARRITRKKPVIAVKSGRSTAGARAVASHTGSLGGLDATTNALFEQCGILRVDSIADMFDLAVAFDSQPLPSGPRVGILTDAGGPGVLATDACEALGLTVPDLAEQSKKVLRANVSVNAGVNNPVDLTAAGGPKEYAVAMDVMLSDPNVDALIVIFVPPIPEDAPAVAEVIRTAVRRSKSQKPVLACFMAEEALLQSMAGEDDHGSRVPVYAYPESCARALAAMLRYREMRSRPMAPALTFDDIDRARARTVIASAKSRGLTNLPHEIVRDLLDAYGFPLVRERLIPPSREAAREAAQAIASATGTRRFAVKYASSRATHKSDLGLVALNVGLDEIADIVARQVESARKHIGDDPDAQILVQEMVTGGRELILGITQDSAFGPVIMFGIGGIYVEVLRDVVFRVPPIGRLEAEQMIDSLRGAPILHGVRGEKGVDLARVGELVGRLSQLALDHPEIAELDMNPLIAFPDAKQFRVVDARITLR